MEKKLLHNLTNSVYNATAHRIKEYCSPLWGGAPVLQLSFLHFVESKALNNIGMTSNENEAQGLVFTSQAVECPLFIYLLNSIIDPSAMSILRHSPATTRRTYSSTNELLIKTAKYDSTLLITQEIMTLG